MNQSDKYHARHFSFQFLYSLMFKCACFLLFFIAGNAIAQNRDTTDFKPSDKDLVEVLLKVLHVKTKTATPKVGVLYFSVMPSTNSSIRGGKLILSSINAGFYLGEPKTTYISSVYFVPYTNLAQQYGFMSTQNLWTSNNLWNIPGDFKIQKLSPYSYGLGSSSPSTDQFVIDYNYIRMYITGNRKLRNYIYGGVGLNYDRHYDVKINPKPVQPNPFDSYAVGAGSSSFSSLGMTLNLLFDNRRNSINPDKGFYSTLVYRINPGFLGNDNVWTSLYVDARRYFRLPTEKRKIIALWAFYWGAYGNVPYLNLPGTGMEYNARSGRGYSLGRFRGKQMLYLESEYRFTFTSNGLFGGVLFANLQSLEEPITHQFNYVNPGAGFGARIKFNKASNINLDLDFGFGKDSFNFYINLGELF